MKTVLVADRKARKTTPDLVIIDMRRILEENGQVSGVVPRAESCMVILPSIERTPMENDFTGTKNKILRIKGGPIGPAERGKSRDADGLDFLLFTEVEDDGYRVRKIVPVKQGDPDTSGPAA